MYMQKLPMVSIQILLSRRRRSLAICKDVFCSNWVTRESQKNVLVQSIQINNYSYMKRRKEEDSSLYRGYKLLLSEDQFEVVRNNYGIVSIPPFRINILSSSESIQFGVKMTKTKPGNKIELREIFRSPHLLSSQHLGSRKILKVFMIHNNVDIRSTV